MSEPEPADGAAGLAHEPRAVLDASAARATSSERRPCSRSAARGSATSVVDDPNVSRRHAEIRREDGAYWIVDLGSTNGTKVNGKRSTGPR